MSIPDSAQQTRSTIPDLSTTHAIRHHSTAWPGHTRSQYGASRCYGVAPYAVAVPCIVSHSRAANVSTGQYIADA
eukprot:909268-Rhodomonas_salina.1